MYRDSCQKKVHSEELTSIFCLDTFINLNCYYWWPTLFIKSLHSKLISLPAGTNILFWPLDLWLSVKVEVIFLSPLLTGTTVFVFSFSVLDNSLISFTFFISSWLSSSKLDNLLFKWAFSSFSATFSSSSTYSRLVMYFNCSLISRS